MAGDQGVRRKSNETVDQRFENLESFPSEPFHLVSAIKTPVTSGRWALMDTNSKLLTPGTWVLNMSALFYNAGANPNYSRVHITLSTSNGDDTAAFPPLTFNGKATHYGVRDNIQDMPSANDTPDWGIRVENFLVVVTEPITLYAVPYAEMSVPGNSRIQAQMWGWRIK